jgi:hypothetical protein
LDRVALAALDHAKDQEIFWNGSKFVAGTLDHEVKVTDESSKNITALFGFGLEKPFLGDPGDTILVDLGEDLAPGDGLLLEAGGQSRPPHPDSTGILIQVKEDKKVWRTLAHNQPRRNFDNFLVNADSNSVIRLLFVGEHQIRSLSRFNYDQVVEPTWLDLTAAAHSKHEDVREAVASKEGASTQMAPGDDLVLHFAVPEESKAVERKFFLQVRGARDDSYSATVSQTDDSDEPQKSWTFSLGAARPNPATGNVTIDYTLAREMDVSIRVYNVAGRLVRTLVNTKQSAGPYDVVWDARDNGSRRVPQGVYFYRMVAGDWTSQKKMVFLGR